MIKFSPKVADRGQVIGPSKIRAGGAGSFGAALGVATLILGLSGPVHAAPKKQLPVDPVTMGSVQIVNALSSDGLVTISVDGRVRARGVPSMASTSPLAVPAGAHRLVIASTSPSLSPPSLPVVGPQQRELSLEISAGSRRTAFLTGSVLTPQLVVVDSAANTPRSAKTARVVDLRAPTQRTTVRIGGVVAELGDGVLSAPVTVAGRAAIDVAGDATASQPALVSSEGPSYVFVVQGDDGVRTGSVRQNLVGLDSLRSPVPVVVPVHSSRFRFFAAIALVFAATGATISSMMVYRGRTRDDRVRGLMAKSFNF